MALPRRDTLSPSVQWIDSRGELRYSLRLEVDGRCSPSVPDQEFLDRCRRRLSAGSRTLVRLRLCLAMELCHSSLCLIPDELHRTVDAHKYRSLSASMNYSPLSHMILKPSPRSRAIVVLHQYLDRA